MEAVDRSQWSPLDWAPSTTSHYRYQEATTSQRHWIPSLPPPPPNYLPEPSHHGGSYNGNYRNGSLQNGYYTGSTASTSPSSQHLSPPTPHQQLLSSSEASNLIGFLDDFNQNPYPHTARGGDQWHQPRQAANLSHHLHPSGGAIQSNYPPSLCSPQVPNRPVQGLYPKIEYPEPELDTKDHLYHYASPPTGSSYSSVAPSPPLHHSSHSTSRLPQAPSSRRRSNSSTESGSGTASPPDQSLSLNRGGSATSPQKRMNHIMSEQRRRNAIREGYHTLIQLLAPEDGGPMIEMPTRGRPKGSSAKNRNRKRGKSGILFRAVELTNWLEEGNDALRKEVARMEAATAHG